MNVRRLEWLWYWHPTFWVFGWDCGRQVSFLDLGPLLLVVYHR